MRPATMLRLDMSNLTKMNFYFLLPFCAGLGEFLLFTRENYFFKVFLPMLLFAHKITAISNMTLIIATD